MHQITEQDRDMLKLILEDIRGIRQRLDTHIEADGKSLRCVQRELSNIREDMAGHRVKITGITAGIALVVSGVVAWVFSHLGK